MTSPFSSFQEFSEAKGPIYTFADNPTMISILLLICLGITIYFFYAAFKIDRDHKPNPAALGILLLASGVSLVTALLPLQSSQQPVRQSVESSRTELRPKAEKRQVGPLALGMTLTGSLLSASVKPFLKRRSRSRRR